MQNFILDDSFAEQVCSGYQQTNDLKNRFQLKSIDCPDCNFTQTVDEYYWFDNVLPFLPLWITLIGKNKAQNIYIRRILRLFSVGSILLTLVPLIPWNKNVPKKVSVPLMKAKRCPQDESTDATAS